MTLRWKTLALAGIGILLLVAGINLATRAIVLRGFEDAERADMARTVLSTRDVVYTMAEEFSQRGTDWSDWNDMAKFLVDGDPEFFASNIDFDILKGIGWDVLMVVAADGYERAAVMRGQSEFGPVPPAFRVHMPKLMRGAAAHAPPIVGLVMIGAEPFLVSSLAIRQTDKTEGPRPGRFITARRIDAPWMQRLQRFKSLRIDFVPLLAGPGEARERQARASLLAGDDTFVRPRDASHVDGYALLDDLYGKPILSMHVERDRDIKVHGDRILASSTVGVLLGGLMLALLTTTLLDSAVLRPLGKLLEGVRQVQSGQAASVDLGSKHEFGQLGEAFNLMALAIAERERSLRSANARTQLVLNAMGDALLTCGLDGELEPDASAAAIEWFGEPHGKVWDYLFSPQDELPRVGMRSDLEQLEGDFLPFELLAEQLPQRFVRGKRSFGIAYRRVLGDDGSTRLLLIVRDLSAQLEAERAARETRELELIVGQLIRDPTEFDRFARECSLLLGRVEHAISLEQLKRDLHTLKGSSALVGFLTFSDACHRLETELAQDPRCATPERIGELWEAWHKIRTRVSAFTRPDADQHLLIGLREYQHFLTMLELGADHASLANVARSWTYESTAVLFSRLESQIARLGERLGKPVRLELQHNDVRVRARPLTEFLASLAHIIRNGVDHGIEAPALRHARGKPATGTISVRTEVVGGELVLSIADDGAGIDWALVEQSARAKGLPHAERADLVAAILHDGLSTRTRHDEMSGAGVGLSAVREAYRALGGSLQVHSELGRGTEFVFRFPLSKRGEDGARVVAWAPASAAASTSAIERASMPG